MKRNLALFGFAACLAAFLSAGALAGGPPASSYDTIYQFFGAQTYNVATAAPGDPGFNGGRWRVIGLSFSEYDAALAGHDTNASGDFDTTAEVQSALADGSAVSLGVVTSFECPVIRIPGSH
jgi:hypothetical protein